MSSPELETLWSTVDTIVNCWPNFTNKHNNDGPVSSPIKRDSMSLHRHVLSFPACLCRHCPICITTLVVGIVCCADLRARATYRRLMAIITDCVCVVARWALSENMIILNEPGKYSSWLVLSLSPSRSLLLPLSLPLCLPRALSCSLSLSPSLCALLLLRCCVSWECQIREHRTGGGCGTPRGLCCCQTAHGNRPRHSSVCFFARRPSKRFAWRSALHRRPLL